MKYQRCLSTAVGVGILAAATVAQGAPLALYEFGAFGNADDHDNYQSSDSNPASIASDLVRGSALGSGTTAKWPNATSATQYSETTGDWRLLVKPPTFHEPGGSDGDFLNDAERAYAGNSYIGFTLAPVAGGSLDLSTFSFEVSTLNSRFFYYYLSSSIDGFDTPIAAPAGVEASSGAPSISLTDARFQNLTEEVEFRLYVWGNQGGSSGSAWAIDSVTVEGNAIPEPATLSMLGVAGLALGRRRRR